MRQKSCFLAKLSDFMQVSNSVLPSDDSDMTHHNLFSDRSRYQVFKKYQHDAEEVVAFKHDLFADIHAQQHLHEM